MIKLLSILGAVGLSASVPSSVVACGAKQNTNDPVASSVDEQGIMTSEFKMKLKKDSITFAPLDKITVPDDEMIELNGLVIINSDIDSEIKPKAKISKQIPATFTVKYKDIKDNLVNTRNKLTKDLYTKIYVKADMQSLRSLEQAKTIIVNATDVYKNEVAGRAVPIVVNLPRLVVDPNISPNPIIPEPIKPAPIIPLPIIPSPVPDKPDHYIPGIIPCSNADLGLVNAEMNEGGTIITAKLTSFPKVKIEKSQVIVRDQDGEIIEVIFVQSDTDDREIDLILDKPVSKDQKLTLSILGIGMADGLTNTIQVDMCKCRYVPSHWLSWETTWDITKKACYYTAAASWYTFKLSVRVAWAICPCSWTCEIVETLLDVTWVPRYILDIQ